MGQIPRRSGDGCAQDCWWKSWLGKKEANFCLMLQKGKRYESMSKFGGAGELTEGSIRTLRTLLSATASPLVKEVSGII